MIENFSKEEALGNTDSFRRDTAYWNDFYKRDMACETPSLFALYVGEYVKAGKTLLELGCGNGRDSLFFRKLGLKVVAVDASEDAIAMLKREHNDNSISFINDDFVASEKLYKEKYDYIYSRFTLHAINLQQETKLLENVVYSLKDEGLFFIEVRSVNDELYGKGQAVEKDAYLYNDHFRRFIRIDELVDKLQNRGLSITYAAEERGFAPYKGSDPQIIRIVAKKGNNIT